MHACGKEKKMMLVNPHVMKYHLMPTERTHKQTSDDLLIPTENPGEHKGRVFLTGGEWFVYRSNCSVYSKEGRVKPEF